MQRSDGIRPSTVVSILVLFFLARNTPLHEMTKMLSVKTAERRHVPAATSIQIYSISHRSLLPPLRSSLFPMYNSHYISFSRRWKKGGKNKIKLLETIKATVFVRVDRKNDGKIVARRGFEICRRREAYRYRDAWYSSQECRGSRVVGLWKWMRFSA